MPARCLIPLLLALLLAGCAYVGEPLPPALNIARKVEDLRAVQRAGRIVVEFTIPDRTTEELPIKRVERVDLRIGKAEGEFSLVGWEAVAQPVSVPSAVPGGVKTEIPAGGWIGSDVVLAVRMVNRKGRVSEWSNLVQLRILESPRPPASVRTEAVSSGVRLEWQGPAGGTYRVYRDNQFLGTAAGPAYTDTAAEFGRAYSYAVQSVVKHGGSEAESEISAPVAITPVDTFPPAVPSGVTALIGINTTELSWERNTEPDFRGYRVYRGVGDGEPQLLDVFLDLPAFSDANIEAGKKYRYSVSAVDRAGNESARSAAVTVP